MPFRATNQASSNPVHNRTCLTTLAWELHQAWEVALVWAVAWVEEVVWVEDAVWEEAWVRANEIQHRIDELEKKGQ
jgi:hypothetical protein